MDATYTLPMHEVLWAFQSGETLTVQRAFKMFHTTELRKIVSRLRRRGYDIRAKKHTPRVFRWPQGVVSRILLGK